MAVAAGKSEPGVMEAWLEGEGAGVGTEALLHAATKAGKVEVVKTLLDRRTVAVDLKDEEGDTALHVAARCTCTSTPILPHPICPHPHILRCGQHEILQLLLAAGADLGEPNLARETPMALLGNLPADITEVRIHLCFISLIFKPHLLTFSSSTHTFCSSSRKSSTPASPPRGRATLCLSPSPTPS